MGMKTWLYRGVVLLAVVLALGAPLTAYASSTEDTNEPAAYAIVNGKEIPIVQGTVLPNSSQGEDGVGRTGCGIVVRGNSYYNRAHVRIEPDEHSNLIVTELVFQHVESSPMINLPESSSLQGPIASSDSEEEYLGYAITWLMCPGAFVNTEVGASMFYRDDSSRVYDGHDPYCWGGWNRFLRWYLIDWGWWCYPDGPDEVWVGTWGEFDRTFGSGYWHHTSQAVFWGYPNGQWASYHEIDHIPFPFYMATEAGVW